MGSAQLTHLVLRGGRVIDPETGLDGIRDVGIADGRVVAISTEPLPGARIVDAAGHVVAPGFVDLHSHAQSLLGQRLRALDGVTTALDLEGGTMPVAATYQRAVDEGRVINFGFSASWAMTRMALLDGVELADPVGTFMTNIAKPHWRAPAAPRETAELLGRLAEGLDEGAVGIGILLGYAPDTPRSEYWQLARLAAARGMPTFTHTREVGREGPRGALDGALEVIAASAATGAHMHLCHLNSTSDRMIDEIAGSIETARGQGLRISTETYPYGSSSTGIGSPFFAPDEMRRRGLDPSTITHLPSGRRVTSFAQLEELRATEPGALVTFDWLDLDVPDDVAVLDRSMLLDDSVFASDALPAVTGSGLVAGDTWPVPAQARAHPRCAGTFARVFGWLVRDRGVLTLPEAVRRCSLLPATILEEAAPAMRRKGRLQVGSDADIVVFDPDTIRDRATYTEILPSAGIRDVLVGGTFVVAGGALVDGARPGRPIYGRGRRTA